MFYLSVGRENIAGLDWEIVEIAIIDRFEWAISLFGCYQLSCGMFVRCLYFYTRTS
jgi:hypothetical protein